MTRRELLAFVPGAALLPGVDAPPTEPPTLQQALADAALPSVVTLSVGPQWEKLPKGKTASRKGADVRQVAQAYDKTVRRFGTVAGVTFPTMTILNTAPDAPNPFDGIPFWDLLPLFAASLSEGQYNALTSPDGIAIGELSDDQQKMARQIFGVGKFKVEPYRSYPNEVKPAEVVDLTDQIGQTRLRFKQTMKVELPSESGGYYGGGPTPPPTDKTLRLVPRQEYGGSQDTVYGQVVRATVPNEPKRGNLQLRQERLLQSVSLDGLTTVRAVVERIAQKSGLELYADARWNHKTVQILGGEGASVVAADLLQALAFCLLATFRQVGPAFVMTDDLTGYGVRRLLWYEFEKYADALRQKPVGTARTALWERYKDRKLSAHGDPAALTQEQQKENWNYNPKNGRRGHSLGDFTADQQAAIGRAVAAHNAMYKEQQVKEDGLYSAYPAVTLQLLAPSRSEPIETGIQVDRTFLMQEPAEARKARRQEEDITQLEKALADNSASLLATLKEHPEVWQFMKQKYPEATKRLAQKYPALASLPTPPPPKPETPERIAEWWKPVERRCVRVYPKTAKHVVTEFAAAKAMGASEVWLTVFAGGALQEDVWQAAQEQAKANDLALSVLIDISEGGKTTPATDCDRTLLGETTSEARKRVEARQALADTPEMQTYRDEHPELLPDENAINPQVQKHRTTLLDALHQVAQAGIKQIVFCDFDLPGYVKSNRFGDDGTLALGYQLDMRLAFLRKHGADPIDLYRPGSYMGKANTDILSYQYDESITQEVWTKWQEFRHEAQTALLAELHKAATPLPVWAALPPSPQYTSDSQKPVGSYVPWPEVGTAPETLTKPDPTFVIAWSQFQRGGEYLASRITQAKPPLMIVDMQGELLASK